MSDKVVFGGHLSCFISSHSTVHTTGLRWEERHLYCQNLKGLPSSVARATKANFREKNGLDEDRCAAFLTLQTVLKLTSLSLSCSVIGSVLCPQPADTSFLFLTLPVTWTLSASSRCKTSTRCSSSCGLASLLLRSTLTTSSLTKSG